MCEAKYRSNAVQCIELAGIATNPATKKKILQHAQEWLKLAYAADARFHELVVEFNSRQMPGQSSH